MFKLHQSFSITKYPFTLSGTHFLIHAFQYLQSARTPVTVSRKGEQPPRVERRTDESEINRKESLRQERVAIA